MSNVVFLRPEVLLLALLLVPVLILSARRLAGLAPWRRGAALLCESLSLLLLVGALAGPMLVEPDTRLNLVLVLDTSASVGDATRQEALAYVRNVLATAGPVDQVRIVAAGRTATLLNPADIAQTTVSGAPDAGGSDLAAGLRLAGSLLGDSGRRRVVLLSDGWETQGQVGDEAARLTARGVDLRVVALLALGRPEVIAEYLSAPPYVRVGDAIPADLRVFSTAATTATLHLSVDGTPLADRSVLLQAGENQIPLDQQAATEGFHRIEATVAAAGDTAAENNTAGATVVVKPAPHVLVLEDRDGEAARLAAALSSQNMTVDVQSSSTVPAQVAGLDGYDAVVMNNVAATSLTLDQQRTLQEYVRRAGRGLVVVGGPTSFAKGGYADSVFEEMLPLSSQPPPRPQQGPTAMILILDRSASMDESDGRDGVSKFAMAKQAARLAVDALRPGDTLGVLTFDTENNWAVPVRTINTDSDKQQAKDLIAAIPLGLGTSIFPAVEEAATAMRGVSAASKHLVLLTDGREYNPGDYSTLLDQMRLDGMTLSTIGIGGDADQDLLTRLARLGQGRYYFTERIETLPQIVFKDLDVALKEAVIEGQVQPHFQAPSPVLRGFAPQDVPQLGGYDLTTAKDAAVIGLVSDQGDPLLAHWNYGLGRVVAFTSAAGPSTGSGGWGAQWLGWDDAARFWSQAVRWSMPSPINPQLQPSITVQALTGGTVGYGTAHLVVESLRADNSFADLSTMIAAVRAPSGAVTTTLLAQTAPGRYEGTVPLAEPGAYEVRLTRQDASPEQTETAGFQVPVSAELLHAGTNDQVLGALAGGHAPLTTPAQALDPQGLAGARPDLQPLWMYLLAPALLLLLASVAARRIDFRVGSRR